MPLIPPPRADLELEDETSSIFDCQNDDEDGQLWEKIIEEEIESNKSFESIPDGWEDVTSEENKILGISKGNYTFKTSSGVKITVEDISDVEIYENKETGEVIVFNANGATITSGSKDAKISVYDSIIDKIDTSKGNDEVNIYNSKVNKIDTGRGIDYINIENSDVDDVQTGSGNDTVNIFNSTIANTNTSSNTLWGLFDDSEDTVIINDTQIGKLKTGMGEDNIIANNSSIKKLNTGSGSDSVNINQTEVGKNKGNKKDTVVQDSNYLDIDLEEIANINSNAQIKIDKETTITVNDYVNYLLEQEVGFETEEEYQEYVLQTLTNNLESMKSIFLTQENSDGVVADGYNVVKELTGLGISDKDVEDMLGKQEAMIDGLTAAMNGESEMSFEQAYEYYTGTTYSQEKIDKYLEVSNIYSAVMVGCQYDEDYMAKFEETIGKSIEDVSREYALCQLDTFGKSTGLQDLVEKYSQDQENFADKLSSAISTAGMACTVTGAILTFFPPTTAVGMGFLTVGRYLSLGGMYIDNALDLVDDATDKDGLTKEELGEFALETGVETISYKAGRGIGKLTNGLNSVVSSKVAQAGASNVTSYIAGQAAETVVDTGLSLGADYAIAQGQSLITTGEFMDSEDYWSLDRFLGEGRSQLIGILIGLSSVKVDAYQQAVIKTAQGMILDGDTDGAKTYLKKSGVRMKNKAFESLVEYVHYKQAVTITAQGMILSGDTEGAKTYLKKSGVEMDDKTFEGFVKNVQDVEAQVKAQTTEGGEPNVVKSVEVDEEVETKPVEAQVEKAVDTTIKAEETVDYSKLTYDEKVKLLEDNDAKLYEEIEKSITEGKISTVGADAMLDNVSSLTTDDIEFIIKNFADNEFYTEQEYIQTFLYFKNLQTKDGIGILNMDEFANKIQQFGIGDVAADLDTNAVLYKNIKAMMDIDPSSETASYMTMLIDLIQNGKVNASALRSLYSLNDLMENPDYFDSDVKWSFSPNLKNDIDKMCDVIASNQNKADLQSELLDAFIPKVKENSEGISKVNIGDVFKIEGEDGIRIKSSDTESVLLNISEETYYKLFPPVERYATSQQVLGDCYCIENMMLLYSLPDQRVKLLEMFSEDDAGNIKIKLPNSDFEVIFEKGEFPNNQEPNLYSSGAEGFKMLEYTYAKTLIENEIKKAVQNLSGEKLADFCKFVEENPNNVFVYQDENGQTSYMKYSEAFEQNPELIEKVLTTRNGSEGRLYPTFAPTLLGNGGIQVSVLDSLGYESSLYLYPSQLPPMLPSNSEIDLQIEEIKNNPNLDQDTKNIHIQYLEEIKNMPSEEKQVYQQQIEAIYKEYENFGVERNKLKIRDELLDENLRNPNFYKENIVQFTKNEHCYGLTCETDSNGNVEYYLYNPHHQGIPIKITDIDEFYDQCIMNSIIIAERK